MQEQLADRETKINSLVAEQREELVEAREETEKTRELAESHFAKLQETRAMLDAARGEAEATRVALTGIVAEKVLVLSPVSRLCGLYLDSS